MKATGGERKEKEKAQFSQRPSVNAMDCLVSVKTALSRETRWQIDAILFIWPVCALVAKELPPRCLSLHSTLSISLCVNPFHTCQYKQQLAASVPLKNRYAPSVGFFSVHFLYVLSNYNSLLSFPVKNGSDSYWARLIMSFISFLSC